MRIGIRIRVNGIALRRAFVEHVTGPFVHGTYMTDDTGRIRDQNGDRGVDSWTSNVDIRIRCQNSVTRVLDGTAANFAVTQDKTGLANGAVVNLNTAAEQNDHYDILNRELAAYDVVFRQFRPFSEPSRSDFPLGRHTALATTMNQQNRIEISYPSQHLYDPLAFNEPKSASTGFPLTHLRLRGSDGRLFGEAGQSPTLVAGELAHALHFSLFSSAGRQQIETDYLGWIINDFANGGGGIHTTGKVTSPMVAYLEAFDLFSGKFAEHVRVVEQGQGTAATPLAPQVMTAQIRQAFIARELSGAPVTGVSVGSLVNGNVVPNAAVLSAPGLHGSDEGAVYGCIFLDFGRRVGLVSAVNAYLRSAADGARTFGGYKTWITNNRPLLLNDLNAAQVTWGL